MFCSSIAVGICPGRITSTAVRLIHSGLNANADDSQLPDETSFREIADHFLPRSIEKREGGTDTCVFPKNTNDGLDGNMTSQDTGICQCQRQGPVRSNKLRLAVTLSRQGTLLAPVLQCWC